MGPIQKTGLASHTQNPGCLNQGKQKGKVRLGEEKQ
jgi:hypothetical protein